MNNYLKPITFVFLLATFSILNVSAQEVRSITQGLSVQVYGNLDYWRSNSLFLGDIADADPNSFEVIKGW